jgi:hypothetical protein
VFESTLTAPWPLPVHLMLTAVYLLTAGVGSWLVGQPDRLETATRQHPPGAGESGA